MAVSGGQDTEGRNVVVAAKKGGLNQQWDIILQKDMPAELKKGEMNKQWGMRVDEDFHIVTRMRSGRYIDLIGTDAVLKTPNSFKSQVFYFDNKAKTIRSRHNGQALNIVGNGGSNNLNVAATNSRWW